ncbi:hypothetical protein Scep_026981 [Stephania cephalantha]|uniref:ATPase, vacuolar ER assembly factor, Vma12 n=1 Tax=Stephania cephalantha TaxID=152367 RepID=A0AAP0EPD0_9MAGN
MGKEGLTSSSNGLIIAISDNIRQFLLLAAKDSDLTEELQRVALDFSSQSSISYKCLRNLWSASSPSTRPKLQQLLYGSDFVFISPKPREKSQELKARLRKLEDLAERKAYRELVKDITPQEDASEPFSSYKDQLGFGLHVALTMLTGYLVGYAAFRALFNHSPPMNAAGGILGLVFAMLLETFLFIIRSSGQGLATSSSATTQKKRQ